MKTLRIVLVPVSLLVMCLGLAATGTKAQSLRITDFAGKFTLPFTAQWGAITLPPGNYNLYYGDLTARGFRIVEIADEDQGIRRGMFIPWGRNDAKGEDTFLVCVFEGKKAYVHSLQMAGLGESIGFARPHGVRVEAWIVAGNQTRNTNARLTQTRIPVLPMK
jgi:hypothetical protein